MAMMRFSSADDPALKALEEKTQKGPIRLKRLKLPTFNAKTRGGYAKGRMKAGELNETEKRYRDFLESERFHGRIQAWWFESIKLKIADHVCWYCPDFLVLTNEGFMELHEVKGSPKFFADDAKVKTKACATNYPFRMLVVYPTESGGWKYQEF